MLGRIPALLFLAASTTAGADELSDRFRLSPAALIAAAALLFVAAYFLIRLLEWDSINKETEDQDDPLA